MRAEYGLIGGRLGHSFSPRIHRELGGYDYELVEIAPEEVGTFLRTVPFRGINVTIPYKQTVIPFLDEISENARRIGSVNTILRRRDGSLIGDNTDDPGFREKALSWSDAQRMDAIEKYYLEARSLSSSLSGEPCGRWSWLENSLWNMRYIIRTRG